MIRKKLTLAEAKKFLKTKGFFLNLKKNSQKKNLRFENLGVFSRTIISSLLIILFFSIMPPILSFQEERKFLSKEFKNNSQNDFKDTLNNKKKTRINEDESLVKKYLFDDIFSYEDLPSDTVRLSAKTIKQLFDDTNYNLQDVRKNKLVKPVSLSLLPNEMKMIENTKKRKELFIQIILPLIIQENNTIKLDRKKLFQVLNKSKNSKNEKIWLEKKFKQYGVANKDLLTLKIRMDEIPTSLAIAQAAKETGWGTSRFALEGNALFGQWTWSGDGIKPAGADDNSTHKVMKFKVLQASVKAYHRNLNTHSSYRNFRSARAELRDEKKELDSLALSKHLDQYAETGKKYVEILQQIIRQNKLTDFDDAKLLPSTIALESLT